MHQGAPTHLCCPGDHILDESFHEVHCPSRFIAEDIALASTGCKYVDNNIRIRRDRTSVGYFSDGV